MRLRRLCFAAAAITVAIALTGCPGNGNDTPVTPTGVTLTPGDYTFVAGTGGEVRFAHTVAPQVAPQAVVWSVTPETAGVTLANDGLLTVAATVPATTTLTVRAAAVGHPAVYDEATVTVTAADVTPATLALYPEIYTFVVGIGGTLDFEAEVGPTGAPQAVVWSVTPETAGVTLDDGLLTVAASVPATTLTVRAAAAGHPTVYDEATVTVTADPATPTSVSLNPEDYTFVAGVGGARRFYPTVYPIDALQYVEWDFYPETAGVTLDDGLLTVAATVPATTTLTITATAVGHDNVYGTATVYVVPPPPASIAITPEDHTFLAGTGGSVQFEAGVGPAGASQAVVWDFYPETAGVTLVDGLLTVAGTVPATTTLTITATAVGHDNVYGTATVYVVPTAAFPITFAALSGMDPITVPHPIRLVGYQNRDIAIEDPALYEADSIRWMIGTRLLDAFGDYGETITLDERVHGNREGAHSVTVVATDLDGVTWSQLITFTVVR